MSITAIILSHYKERENNLKRIVDDLLSGTVKPEKIIIFIDNPQINYEDNRVVIIKASHSFLPIIRFGIGAICDSDYCFFIDDDLTVRKRTLENFLTYANNHEILGLEGSLLGEGTTPYTNDTPITRGLVDTPTPVDIIIRTYFVPTHLLAAGLELRSIHPELPKKSLDDIYLCLGNKLLNFNINTVIPVDSESDLTELSEGGVGQSYDGEHYKNRNEVCYTLLNNL